MKNYPDNILRKVNNPLQYIGNEYNIVRKDPKNKIRILLSFPDLYLIGMSSLGHLINYNIFNSFENVYAERAYAVEKDMEELLRQNSLPLISLETKTPLNEFDTIGFTIEYELTYTNILQILELGNVELFSEKRDENSPIVVAGGTATYNPLPIEKYIDIFFIGESEWMSDDIVKILSKWKWGEINRNGALELFDQLPYTYVPSLSGKSKDVFQVIDEEFHLRESYRKTLVPIAKTVYERDILEISRGCTRGCRFCQAGFIYRPVREKETDIIVNDSIQMTKNSGFDEITLLSLSATDFKNLYELLKKLNRNLSKYKTSISLPSLRIGAIGDEILEEISQIRKSGLTIAVETASERLRRVINKDISNEEVINTINRGKTLGWKHVKLYFMIGLPTENNEDIDETIKFLNYLGKSFKDLNLNVSFSPFVPKPFTPFQWVRQNDVETLKRKMDMILNGITQKNITISYRDPEISFLEGVFSRGDSRLNGLILKAYKNGCRLDEWSEHFDFKIWKDSADQMGINLSGYLNGFEINEVLPWDFIKTLVNKSFLEKEYLSAEKGVYTQDCRIDKCTGCGACKGEIAGELLKKEPMKMDSQTFLRRKVKKLTNSVLKKTKILLLYSIEPELQYLSHLSIINLLNNAFRRTNLPFVFTQGYNPRIKMNFGFPKPIFVYSKMEMVELWLDGYVDEGILEILNEKLPYGIRFYYFKKLVNERDSIIKRVNKLNMVFDTLPQEKNLKSIEDFLSKDSFLVERIINNKSEEVDIRKYVDIIEMGENKIKATLNLTNKGNIKFEELYRKVLGFEELDGIKVFREKFFIIENGKTLEVINDE